MQEGYVHSLPKTKRLTSQGAQDEQDLQKQRRLAIIFRHGQERMVDDSGKPAELLTAPAPITNEQRYPFGSMPEILQEGNVYSRVHLAETYAHRYAKSTNTTCMVIL